MALTEGLTLSSGETLTKTGDGELSVGFVLGESLDIEAGIMRLLSDSSVSEVSIADGATLILGDDGSMGGAMPGMRDRTDDGLQSDLPGSSTTVVPEPSLLALLGVGGITLQWRRRRC